MIADDQQDLVGIIVYGEGKAVSKSLDGLKCSGFLVLTWLVGCLSLLSRLSTIPHRRPACAEAAP